MSNNLFVRLLAVLLLAATVLAGCRKQPSDAASGDAVDNSTSNTIEQSGEESMGAVKDVPAEIGLTVTASGSYTIDKAINGTVVIDTDAALRLTLKNAVITGTTGPAIYVKNSKGLEIVLEGENTLSDSAEYAVEQGELKGTLFSEDDVVFTGSGSLTVTGNRGHAIASDDGITVNGGSITVASAVKDGVHANDLVAVTGGSLTVQAAGSDAVECEAVVTVNGGTVNLTSTGDGIKASLSDKGTPSVTVSGGSITVNTKEDGIQSDGTLDITDGVINITTTGVVSSGSSNQQGGMQGGGMRPGGGGRPTRPGGFYDPNTGMQDNTTTTTTTDDASSKGIKASGALIISGGTINITSTDDALHSNADLTVSGGTMTLSAGDDGIHADGALVINKGVVTVTNSYEALEGKSVDINDGVLTLTASDDGINATSGDGGFNRPGNANADNKINVGGGSVYIMAGGDGVDSNGTLTVNSGVLCVEGSGNGNSAIDADGTRLVNGGVVVALGSGDMLEPPQASSKQNCAVLICNAGLTAGTTAALTDSKGNVLFCFTISKSARSITLSLPQLTVGETYTLYTGVTPAGTASFAGLYYGNGIGFTGGKEALTFTQTSTVTQAR